MEVAFNQPVKIGSFCILSTCARTVGLRVAIGGNTRIFRYASGDRTRKLTFNYTVQSDDLDTDGIGVLRLVKVPNAQRYIQSVSSGEALADYYYALPGDLSFARNAGHLVIPGAVTFGGRTIASQTLHVARPVRLELPAAAGGIGALSYQLTPALPDGLRWTAPGRGAGHGGVIAGTPRSGTRRAALFALTARDPRGVEASLYFYVHVSTGGTVNDVRIVSTAPGRGYYTKDDVIRLRATFNGEVAGATGPTLKLAVGTTTHTLQNQAPAGSNPKNYLDFSYTVRADDRDTDGVGLPANALGGQVRVNVAGVSGAQNASLSLAALPDQAAHVVRGTQTTPDFGSASVAERTVTPANAVDISLPAATGGEGRVSYALTPAVPGGAPDLPAGLSYASPADAASGGKISGRPAAGKSRTRYTLTATDEDGDTDTVSFFLTATDSQPSLAAIADRIYAVGHEIDEALPAATGGDGVLSHVLTGPGGATGLTLPAGLAYAPPGGGDAHGGTIAGAPRGAAAPGVYELTATDVDGDEASATFRIETKLAKAVVAPTALAFAEGASAAYTLALSTPPAGTASITIESDHAAVTATPSPLTFTASDYDTPQTVTVRAARDDDGETDRATLSHAVSGYGAVTAGAAVSATISDTDVPGVAVAPTGLTVHEGASRSYAVKLDTRPAGTVTVSVASDNAEVTVDTDGTPLARTLTFAPNDWNTAQSVIVSLSEDDDGEADAATLSHGVSGYGTVTTASAVTVTGVENDSRGLILSPSGLGMTEEGSATYTVALVTRPVGTVTVTVSSDNAEVTVDTDSVMNGDQNSLTFTPDGASAWNVAQTVTVQAAADADAVNDAATLRHTTTGYASVQKQASVTVTDDDAAGLVVSPTRLEVNEESSAIYTVTLAAQPSGNVAVTVTASGDADVTVDADSTPRTRTLTFTSTTWNTPQTVTVSAAADDDGADDMATLGHAANGGGYGSATASVSVAVTDDDTPGVIVAPAALTVAEGMSATYTAKLATQPAGPVTVTATASGDADVTIDADSTPRTRTLTFTSSTWNTPQTVTVSAASDDDGAADRATIGHAVGGYGTVTAASAVSVTVTDDETAGVSFSATSLAVPEGGTAAYTVALDTPPIGIATIRIASDNGEVTVRSGAQSAAQHLSLTFTANDYATAQTVTVSAARDNDADVDTATLSHAVAGYGAAAGDVAVTVTETDSNDAPGFGSAVVANQDWRTGKAVELQLPAASGGNGGLRYALTPLRTGGIPDLPGGLSFDAVSRLISGAPEAPESAVTYTYTVQDADSDLSTSDSASLTFSVSVKTNSIPVFATTVPVQRYKRGTAISGAAGNWVELPAATGGNPPVAYALEGPSGARLPDGLAFTAATRRIAGTPQAVSPAAAYTYAATDSDGDKATLSIVVRVVPNTVVTFPNTATVPAQNYMAGTQIAPLSLPEATGGDGALTYTLEGTNGASLPQGLSYARPAATDHHGGTLSGTPEAARDATSYTLKATDGDGDTATLTFTIAVAADSMPSFDHVAAPSLVYKTTKSMSFVPPRAIGGDAPVTYALTGPGSATTLTLPQGLRYRQSATFPTGRLDGAPTGAAAAADYTLTATDADGDAATLSISLEARANRIPAFAADSVVYRYRQWRTLDPPQVLPAAIGGDGAIAYEVLALLGQPGLPKGLTYAGPEDADDGGGILSGAPEEAGTFSFRLDATDEDGDRPPSSKSITIVVDAAPSFQGARRGSSHYFVQNREIDPLELPGATGGDGTIAYTLQGPGSGGSATGQAVVSQSADRGREGLPQGMTYVHPAVADGNGGTITGMPLEVMIESAYRLTATDEDGDTSTFEFTMEVVPNLIPDFGTDSLPAQRYVQHRKIAPLDFPDPGGSQPVTYVLENQTLPPGLVLDESEGALSGTPTEALPRTTYTLTVVDRNGDRDTLDFTIEVESNLAPSFGDAAARLPDHVVVGTAIEATLPAAVGGDTPLDYRLEPALPDGLGWTAPARGAVHGGIIEGTPTVPRAESEYRLTATDANGDTATLAFTIEVEADLLPSFGDAVVPPQRWRAEVPIQPLVLPAATGGNGTLAYALAPDPPTGLTYTGPGSGDRHGGVVDGTPAAEAAKTRYTLTARDADGDEATLAFTIEVLASVAAMRGRALKHALAGFGRAVAAGAVEAIGGRFERDACGPEAGSRAPPGEAAGPVRPDVEEPAQREETLTARELLSRGAFDLRLGGDPAGDCGAWSLWGLGDVSSFSSLRTEGDVATGFLGTDLRPTPTLLLGMTVSHSAGDMDYDLGVNDALSQGTVEADLTAVLPYLHWSPREGLGLWGLLGAGRGGAALSDAMGAARTDIEMWLAAAGGRDELLSRPGASLALKADAFSVTLKSEAKADLGAAKGEARRLRLALEGRAALSPRDAPPSAGRLEASLEFGGRWDGGDAGAGLGQEIGGGLAYRDEGLGLEIDVGGRYLLAHQENDFSESGASAALSLDPGVPGRGLSFAVAPAWGAAASGMERLWREDRIASWDGGGATELRAGTPDLLELELAYGAQISGLPDPLVLYVALSKADRRRYRVGGRVASGGRIEAGLELDRMERTGGASSHGVLFELRLRH